MRRAALTPLHKQASLIVRCLVLVLFCIVRPGTVHSQNLIPNTSFEELDVECMGPMTYGAVQQWTSGVCSAGGVLYHRCSTDNGFPTHGTPGNAIGHQAPVEGVAYCALYTYTLDPQAHTPYSMTAPLLAPLSAGVEYCFSASASLADRSAYSTPQMHVLFTPQILNGCNGTDTTVWLNTAQVTLNTTGVDTASWSLLSGSFVAAGGESYITIGNFRGTLDPDTVYLGPTTYHTERAMFYLDALELRQCVVSVEEHVRQGLQVSFDPSVRRLSLSSGKGGVLAMVALHDMAGRTVPTKVVGTEPVQLDLASVPNGVYVVQVRVGSQMMSSRVVVY